MALIQELGPGVNHDVCQRLAAPGISFNGVTAVMR